MNQLIKFILLFLIFFCYSHSLTLLSLTHFTLTVTLSKQEQHSKTFSIYHFNTIPLQNCLNPLTLLQISGEPPVFSYGILGATTKNLFSQS